MAVGSKVAFSRPSRMNSFPSERYCLGSKNVASATPPATTTKNKTAFFRWRKKAPATSPSVFVGGLAPVITNLLCFPCAAGRSHHGERSRPHESERIIALGCGRSSELSLRWFGTKLIVVKALDGSFPVIRRQFLPLAETPCQREKQRDQRHGVNGKYGVSAYCSKRKKKGQYAVTAMSAVSGALRSRK